MTESLLYNIMLQMQGQNKVLATVNDVQKKTTGMVNSIKSQLNAIKLNAIIDNVNRVADGINNINDPGIKLAGNMKDLQAITGVAGEKLKQIEGYARSSAKTFGGSAAQGVESYKFILSQLSPEIAKVPTALKSMGETVNYTSKLMSGDTTAATEVLTTAMNQYGISLDDPTKASKIMAAMMNVMAASAKEGSAELLQIKQALENSGMAAKAANVAFEETNAAIQILDKSGKKGAEGGVALRNVLATLGQGRFLPKEVRKSLQALKIDINKLNDPNLTLSQRLRTLKPLLNDTALLSAMFGKENQNAAMALIQQTGEMDRLTAAVKGTSSAYEQAAIIMESPAEKNARLKAQVDDFKITLFNATNGWLGYASVVADTSRDLSNLAPIFSGVSSAISFLTNAQKMSALWTKIVTGAQWLWNAALTANPIGIVVVAIGALVTSVAVAIKYYDKWGAALLQFMGPVGWVINGFKSMYDHWESIKKAFKTEGVISGLKRLGVVILDTLLKPFQQILEVVDKVTGTSWSESIKKLREEQNLVTDGDKIQKALDEGRLVMYNGKAILPSSRDKFEKARKAQESGIVPPTNIPGSATVAGSSAGDAGAKEKGKKIADSIATGGSKHNYITLNIKELVGIQNYSGSKDSASRKMGEEVLDELLRATSSAITAAG